MRFLAGLSVVTMILSSSTVWAESSDDESDEFVEQVTEGHRLFANNEREAALRAYRRALREGSNDAMATYFIACAQRAEGDLDEALESFQSAARLAGDSNAALKVRALMGVAFVQEARRDFAAARAAWRAYIEYAEAHSSARSYIQNARQRLDVITSWEELDAAYGPVRERIQAGEAGSSSQQRRRR